MNSTRAFALTGTMGIAFAGTAGAAEILVDSDITTSTTWTADNTYNLQTQVFVSNGATLTIEPGTVVASTPTVDGSGSLAITRGSKIIAEGTRTNPIIFTSTADDFETWREAANEWGNLTIMGRGYISNSFVDGNTASCNANNESPMEGLVEDFAGDPNTRYGGDDDDDDSGVLKYVSIRYGGRVIGLANELNGLSLGGVGRGTEIDYVEIMNNVDDGIEIWGGTVNLKHFSIWNVGDDSLDVDQGWRGKGQFGLIVQGYSVDADQGSGVGDNCIETDGAEDSDAQPVTTAVLYNMTVIGQPVPGAGDGMTAWRDNARVQYRQCIMMDCGEQIVRFDGDDGDGSQGYGHNGTRTWAQTWNRPYTETSSVNPCADPASIYQAQTSGNLAEIVDTVFFRNLATNAYAQADGRGVTVDGGSNPAKDNVVANFIQANPNQNMPIVALDRADPVDRGGTTQIRVTSIDPRPAGAAVNSAGSPPDDGFFTVTNYRGAFSPTENWLTGWTAADEYGFVVAPPCVEDLTGDGVVGFADLTQLLGAWGPCPGCPEDLNGDGVAGFADLTQLLGSWGPCADA